METTIHNNYVDSMRWLHAPEINVVLSGTGSATVTAQHNDKFVIDCTACEAAKTLTIETPFPFEVSGVTVIHGNTTACTVTVKNGTDSITDAIAATTTDGAVVNAAKVLDSYSTFSKDDDDLVAAIGTGAFTGKIIVHYLLA